MKSKISIDVDYDNQPIIKIEYLPSEDVRDKLVKKFLETFAHDSIFCTHFFESDKDDGYKRTIIRPISPNADYFKDLHKIAVEKMSEEVIMKEGEAIFLPK